MPDGVKRTYRFSDFTLEVSEHRLRRGDEEIVLRPKAFETLLYLVERQGHLVEKNELLDTLWVNTVVTETVLTHCITEIRQALQDDIYQPRYIKTISRVGYKFIAPVEELTAAAEAGWAVTESKPSFTIAVLPFVNLSADPEAEYFCDGLAEDLINALTKVKGLRVVARTSAFSFKHQELDIREIGQRLNVTSVLEGSVQKAGNRLRILTQLINAADGYHLWSERFDRRMDDVFAIQDEIALTIVDKLKVKLLAEEKAALVKRHTENLDAYHLYLKGRYFWNKRFAPGVMQQALEYFHQAIENDPCYALAYTGLADCYNLLGLWQFRAPEDVFPQARTAAEKALELDDTLAEAHTSLAFTKFLYEWDWSAAEREFKQAIELNPSYAPTHLWYAHYLCAMGRLDEAIAEIKRAQALDPLSLSINANAGVVLYFARKYEQAVEQLQKTLELDPNFGLTHHYLGVTYVQEGRYGEAVAAFQKAIEHTGGMPLALSDLGYAYGRSGERVKAKKVLHEMEARSKERYISSYVLALIYLGLGEHEKVFEWLSRGYEERSALLPWLKILPEFDPVRSDPRFQALLRRLGLAP